MSKFWELYEKSAIVSGVVTLAVVGVAVYTVVAQIPMPDYFIVSFGTVIAYFFSEKSRASEARAQEKRIVTANKAVTGPLGKLNQEV